MCRSRRELSNEYLLAEFGFDTAENEPCKVCPLSAYISPRLPRQVIEELMRCAARTWHENSKVPRCRRIDRLGRLGFSTKRSDLCRASADALSQKALRGCTALPAANRLSDSVSCVWHCALACRGLFFPFDGINRWFINPK